MHGPREVTSIPGPPSPAIRTWNRVPGPPTTKFSGAMFGVGVALVALPVDGLHFGEDGLSLVSGSRTLPFSSIVEILDAGSNGVHVGPSGADEAGNGSDDGGGSGETGSTAD